MENIKKISQCCEKQAQGSENSESIDVLNDVVNTKDGDNGKQISSIRFINTLFNDDEYSEYKPTLVGGWVQNGNIDNYKSNIMLNITTIINDGDAEVTKSKYYTFGTIYITVKPYTYKVTVELVKNSDGVDESYKNEYNGVLQKLKLLLNKKYDKQITINDMEFNNFEMWLNQTKFFNYIFRNFFEKDSVILENRVVTPRKINITHLMVYETLININNYIQQQKDSMVSIICNDDSSEDSVSYFSNIFDSVCIGLKINNNIIYFSSTNFIGESFFTEGYENVKLVKNQKALLNN